MFYDSRTIFSVIIFFYQLKLILIINALKIKFCIKQLKNNIKVKQESKQETVITLRYYRIQFNSNFKRT